MIENEIDKINNKRNSVTIDELFHSFVKDMADDYALSPEDQRLHLSSYSAEQLIAIGFCNENVNQILASVVKEEVLRFFEENVSHLTAFQLGGIEVSDTEGIISIGEFIYKIKYKMVRSYLNIILSTIVRGIKEGKSIDSLQNKFGSNLIN